MGEDELRACSLFRDRWNQDHQNKDACRVPEDSELAQPGQALDGEAVDETVHDQDGGVNCEQDVLGGHVATAVGSPGAQQDHHLDQLRQREVHAHRASPL